MDEKEILAVMEEGFSNLGDTFGKQLAELNETAKAVLVPRPEDVKTAAEVKAEESAKLAEAGIGGIAGYKPFDIPIGQGIVGGFGAVFASELIDGFLVNQSDMVKGVIKLGAAGATVKWGCRLLGSTGSKAMAILLAYDGIRSLVPIDTWAKTAADAVTGIIPGGGLGGFKPNVKVGVVEQANQVAGDYYARAEGR